MIRITLLSALLLALCAPMTTAQVATTDLVPAQQRFVHPNALGYNATNIAPDNPAAVAWGNSLVGAGALEGTFEDNTQVPPLALDFSGAFGGFRAVGEVFGVAADTLSVEQDLAPGATIDETTTGQVSLNLGGALALGVGAQATESESALTDLDRLQGGLSLRLGDVVYVGAAMYQDTLDLGLPVTFDRDGTLLGIALRTEGDWRWYVAYEVVDLDNFDFTPVGGTPDAGLEIATGTVQLNAGGLLLGAAVADVKPANGPEDVSITTVDLGYVPMAGLAITARVLTTAVDEVGLPDAEKVESTSIALSWLF